VSSRFIVEKPPLIGRVFGILFSGFRWTSVPALSIAGDHAACPRERQAEAQSPVPIESGQDFSFLF
jgi:hypothetical protein